MAHNLSTFNGQTTMAYFGQSPWHKLGKRLSEDAKKDVILAMQTASLDWTVERQPLFLSDGRQMPDAQAIVRTADRVIFGTVGDRFRPIQNVEAFSVLSDAINDAGVTIESAGAIGNGSTVWMLAKFGEGKEVTKGDVVNPYFLISQAHDGSRAYGARLTPIRVVCQNTLNAATSSGKNEISIRHTSNAATRLQEAKRLINTLSGIMEQTIETYQTLASIEVSTEDVRTILMELFPIQEDATPEVRAKQMAAIANVGILRKSGIGSDLSGNTAWGLYNAVTEYVDHVKPAEVARDSKSDARKINVIQSAIFGSGDALKVQALRLTRQLVAA